MYFVLVFYSQNHVFCSNSCFSDIIPILTYLLYALCSLDGVGICRIGRLQF